MTIELISNYLAQLSNYPTLFKTCYICKKNLSISEFHKSKASCKTCLKERMCKWISKNRIRYLLIKSNYKKRHPTKVKESIAKNYSKIKSFRPWEPSFYQAQNRCNNPKNAGYRWYGGKGVKFRISMDEFKSLWIRDMACKMKKPSIDRIDSNGNYEFSNCRFIEQSENSRRKSVSYKD